MEIQTKPTIRRTDNRILVYRLDHPKCVSNFLRQLSCIIGAGYHEVILEGTPSVVFPNALLPICGIIEYYKSVGYTFINQIEN